MKVIDTVTKLIALANHENTPLPEKATAAYKAIQLIHRHSIKLLDPRESAQTKKGAFEESKCSKDPTIDHDGIARPVRGTSRPVRAKVASTKGKSYMVIGVSVVSDAEGVLTVSTPSGGETFDIPKSQIISRRGPTLVLTYWWANRSGFERVFHGRVVDVSPP